MDIEPLEKGSLSLIFISSKTQNQNGCIKRHLTNGIDLGRSIAFHFLTNRDFCIAPMSCRQLSLQFMVILKHNWAILRVFTLRYSFSCQFKKRLLNRLKMACHFLTFYQSPLIVINHHSFYYPVTSYKFVSIDRDKRARLYKLNFWICCVSIFYELCFGFYSMRNELLEKI